MLSVKKVIETCKRYLFTFDGKIRWFALMISPATNISSVSPTVSHNNKCHEPVAVWMKPYNTGPIAANK
jgi:hypothetical protein